MPNEENKTVSRRYFEKVLHDFWYTILGMANGKVDADSRCAVAREIPGIVSDSLAEEGTLFDRLFLWEQLGVVPATVDCLARVNHP